tara:strand:+ start:455 stop:610 length:156 start_codon:yes stop_codon:yes gene_type:complete
VAFLAKKILLCFILMHSSIPIVFPLFALAIAAIVFLEEIKELKVVYKIKLG